MASNRVGRNFLVGALLAVQFGLLAWVGICASPNNDEVGHLGAGCYLWAFGRFDVYRVNPPLVRAVGAMPAVVGRAKCSWTSYICEDDGRPEWELGKEFIAVNGGIQRAFRYFVLGRWLCIPFLLIGGMTCCRWATDLYGWPSGVIALLLWCFCPNVIAWGATICPDAPAAAMGVVAGFAYWRWLKQRSWACASVAGIALGVAALTKLTWILLFGLWPCIWFVWFWPHYMRERSRNALIAAINAASTRRLTQLAVILTIGFFVLNLGYGFDGTFRQLRDYRFTSRTFAGSDSLVAGRHGGNRFRDAWLGIMPVPMPNDYVSGLDLQKTDFELGSRSFLFGEWKDGGGWWYYYLACTVLKEPVGIWLLGLLAAGLTVFSVCHLDTGRLTRSSLDSQQPRSGHCLNEATLLLPAVAVFVLASSQTGINSHFRYVLPAFPFAFIWISKSAQVFLHRRKVAAAIVCVSVAWMIQSSIFILPNSLSYFNELAGGPRHGHNYLIDTNIDWGQDMWRLRQWYDEHPQARPLGIASRSLLDPEAYGIRSTTVPTGPPSRTDGLYALGLEHGPRPGWYAVSTHYIHEPGYQYFQLFKPVESIGCSMYIYDITREQANLVRKELGLPELFVNSQPEEKG